MWRERTPSTSSGDRWVRVIRVIPGFRSIWLSRRGGVGDDLHSGGQAAVLAMLLGLVESGVCGVQELVLLLLDGSPRGRIRPDRRHAERRGYRALEVQGRVVEAVGARDERRRSNRVTDGFGPLH